MFYIINFEALYVYEKPLIEFFVGKFYFKKIYYRRVGSGVTALVIALAVRGFDQTYL